MVDDCGCRKGAIRPFCPRHDPMERLTPFGQLREAFIRGVHDLVAWFERHDERARG